MARASRPCTPLGKHADRRVWPGHRDRKGWSPSPLSRLGPLQTECHNGGMVSITSFLQKDKRSRKTCGMDLIRKKEPCTTQVPITAITRCLRCCLHCHPHAGPPPGKPAGHVPPARRPAMRPAGSVSPGFNHSRLYPVHPSDATLFYQFTVYSYLIVTGRTKGS